MEKKGILNVYFLIGYLIIGLYAGLGAFLVSHLYGYPVIWSFFQGSAISMATVLVLVMQDVMIKGLLKRRGK